MLERIKQAYLLWCGYYSKISKLHKYSLGLRIDFLFVEIIEALSEAAYVSKEKKLLSLGVASRKHAALVLLLMVLWEARSLDTKKYVALSQTLNEVGKMLGGWMGQLQKQNSPEQRR